MFSDILLTADYDHTLTGPDGSIPERNLEAIRYFMENGGAFTVNTGRSLPMARKLLETVPLNAPALLYNGGAAYDVKTGKFLFTRPIPLDLWETVTEIHRLVPDMQVEIQGVDHHYAFTENPIWEKLTQGLGCTYRYAVPGEDLGPFLKFTLLGPFVPGAGIFDGDNENATPIPEVMARLRALVGDTCSIYWSGKRIVDVQERQASKAHAAQWLKEFLNRRILVCAGDAQNDIPMLDAADYAFCPADGVVKDRYENVCSCGFGAVADVIYEKIPGILRANP